MRRRSAAPSRARAAAFAAPAVLGVVATLVSFGAGGCGTDAIGVETCRTLETARCRRAPACGVDLSRPVGVGDEVESCIRFYKDACLHGLASKLDPGGPGVDACVNAIANGTCDVVLKPETDPACAFLIPPAPPPAPADAGNDG